MIARGDGAAEERGAGNDEFVEQMLVAAAVAIREAPGWLCCWYCRGRSSS